MLPLLEELVDELSRLPSIGRKSAWRLALFILEDRREQTLKLADTLHRVKNEIVTCSRCFNYAQYDPCEVCASPVRDAQTICVVEKAVDVFTIENSGRYRGQYFVLGGVLSPINGITPDKLRIAELVERIEGEKPAEVILALGGSSESETTGHYIGRLLENTGVRLTRLARGLPAGAHLEYVDPITLIQALNERTGMGYGSQST